MRASRTSRLNAHWQRGGLWLADGSTILPDAVYGTGQLAQDLALASTEGSLDPQSEERRRQAQERLAAHRYSLAAQNADQVEARYLDMTPVSPERQARLDDLVASGVPAPQAEEVLLQRSIAARIRLQHAGIPIDYAVGDRLEQQGMMAPSSEFVPPSLALTAPSNADGAEGGAPIGPETVYNALVPSSPSMALQLAIPGLLRGMSTIAPGTAAAVLQSTLGASAAGSQSVAIPALGSGLEPSASGTGAVGGLGAAVILGTVMSLVIANGGVPVQPMGQSPLVAPGKDSEDVPSVNVPWSQQGVNPWTTGRPGPVPTEQVPGTATVAPP